MPTTLLLLPPISTALAVLPGHAASCPSPKQRAVTKRCTAHDRNPTKCEQKYLLQGKSGEERKLKGGWAFCWHMQGRCQSLLDVQSSRSMGALMARLHTAGCSHADVGLPHDVPSPPRFSRQLSSQCGALSGWEPIVNCSHMAEAHPCGSNIRANALRCRSMVLVDGHKQCYTREQPRADLPKWSATNLFKARVCGSKPCDTATEAIFRRYLLSWSPNASARCPTPMPEGRDSGRNMSKTRHRHNNILILVDRPCNGCSDTPSGKSNLWHRMARMFTVWQALKAVGCSRAGTLGSSHCRDAPLPRADLLFTGPTGDHFPESSSSGWSALSGGSIIRYRTSRGSSAWTSRLDDIPWCRYEQLLVLPFAPRLVFGGSLFDPDRWWNTDKLWTLAYGRHLPCTGSEVGDVWRTFTQDMLERVDLRHMMWPTYLLQPTELIERRDTQVCFLLRTDPTVKPGKVDSWNGKDRELPRYEAHGSVEEIHRALRGVCHGLTPLHVRNVLFHSSSSLRDQAAQMAGCNVAMGIHGAQLMNVMWMEPGSAVVEFHRLPPANHSNLVSESFDYYYRNVASLSGHTYFSRQICDVRVRGGMRRRAFAHCAGEAKEDGVHLDVGSVREVVTAAVAAVGHAGGVYDDRPVAACE